MEVAAENRPPDGPTDVRGPAGPDQVFEIRIAGLLPDGLLSELPGIELCSTELRTVLTGQFQDQAELHGFLARLRSLRLDLVEVRRIHGAQAVTAGDPGEP
jgi:hypothetical protein